MNSKELIFSTLEFGPGAKPENLSSELIGPYFFEKFMKNYQQNWAHKINEAGKHSFIHMDGSISGLLKQESQVGLSVIEALTPAPVGDVAVENWKDYAGDSSTILWGGIPGSYFTELVDESEFESFVIRLLKTITTEPRYVLGVADQIPPGGLEKRVRRVAEIVDKHGGYQS